VAALRGEAGDGVRGIKWWQALSFAVGCLIGVALLVATYMGLLSEIWMLPAPWFLVGLALGVVCHEAGHALCAVLGGLPIRLVSIGLGPLLARRGIGEARIDLRLLPFRGLVATYPLFVARKGWMLVFVAGGVAANAALIALVAVSDALGAVPDWAANPLRAVVVAQILLIVDSLIPHRVTIEGMRLGTDGLQLLQLLRSPRKGPTEVGTAYGKMLAAYATQPGPHEMPAATTLASQRIAHYVLGQGSALRERREGLERELEGHLPREEELLVLDWLVTRGLTSGDSAFRERLDEWSLRALQLGPDVETLRGSRGAVLAELGRWEAAKSMLSKVVAADGSFDALMTQIYLARAEHALGNTSVAKDLAAAARKTSAALPVSDATSKLLPRLEAELGAVSDPLGLTPLHNPVPEQKHQPTSDP
jgi:peptidase M50-like protein